MSDSNSVMTDSVRRILIPLVRLLLRHGVSFQAMTQLLREVYVDVASREFAIPGKKQTVSRISTLTGLTRKEVARCQQSEQVDLQAYNQRFNRAARVISGWTRDARYQTAKGAPRVLDFEGDEPSFTTLVREFSGDVPPRAIADELLRVGAIDDAGGGRVRLVDRAYVPGKDVDEKLQILGTDVADLIGTIDHNAYGEPPAFFQRKVMYAAIPDTRLSLVRDTLRDKAQSALESMDGWLSKVDGEVSREERTAGNRRLGVGIYYFEERTDAC